MSNTTSLPAVEIIVGVARILRQFAGERQEQDHAALERASIFTLPVSKPPELVRNCM
jgi:hypothetical protein